MKNRLLACASAVFRNENGRGLVVLQKDEKKLSATSFSRPKCGRKGGQGEKQEGRSIYGAELQRAE
jgi:hypothetical protein